jgi:hypothetical protein
MLFYKLLSTKCFDEDFVDEMLFDKSVIRQKTWDSVDLPPLAIDEHGKHDSSDEEEVDEEEVDEEEGAEDTQSDEE